jgi:hypothetical protein
MQSSLIYGVTYFTYFMPQVRPNLELIPGFKFVPVWTLFLIRLVVLEKRSCENAIK